MVIIFTSSTEPSVRGGKARNCAGKGDLVLFAFISGQEVIRPAESKILTLQSLACFLFTSSCFSWEGFWQPTEVNMGYWNLGLKEEC